MPSRKKAKGQARKAEKAAEKAKNEAAQRTKELEEFFRDLEQGQIQWLQNSNAQRQRSVLSCICMHGFDPFPNDDICIKFIRAFIHEYYKCYIKSVCGVIMVERPEIEALLKARDATKEEYSEVWNSAAKMKRVIKYFLYNGTMSISTGGDDIRDRDSVVIARFFEQWLKVKVHKSQACIDWLKLIESARCDDRTVVKYFWRRIRCSCLDEKYDEVKSMPKMGVCLNHQCSVTVERSKLRCCSRCCSVSYCSRECQVADWSKHTSFCDEVAVSKLKVEFDASQQQQS